MGKVIEDCLVLTNRRKSKNICEIVLESNEIAKVIKPGQFLNIKCGDGVLLRRPLSICDVWRNKISVVFEIRGEGTKFLSERTSGDELNVLGPLGNSFSMFDKGRVLIVGGGIGVIPLYLLAKYYGDRAVVALGYKCKDCTLMLPDFAKTGAKVFAATDDGSLGFKGNAVTLARELISKEKFDYVYGCGPKPMLASLSDLVAEKDLPCEISMEERMGCGIGACLVCACKTKGNDGKEKYSHVCIDGPIFKAGEVIFE